VEDLIRGIPGAFREADAVNLLQLRRAPAVPIPLSTGALIVTVSTDSLRGEIGKRLRHVRRKAGLSPDEVAKGANLTKRRYEEIEAGKVNPSISTLARIAVVLRCTLDDLVPPMDSKPARKAGLQRTPRQSNKRSA